MSCQPVACVSMMQNPRKSGSSAILLVRVEAAIQAGATFDLDSCRTLKRKIDRGRKRSSKHQKLGFPHFSYISFST